MPVWRLWKIIKMFMKAMVSMYIFDKFPACYVTVSGIKESARAINRYFSKNYDLMKLFQSNCLN